MEYTIILLLLIYSCSRALTDKLPEGKIRMISTSSNLKIDEGTSVLLPCNVLNIGEGDVRIWRKLPGRTLFSGLISVSSDPRISLVDKSSLHIENVTPEYSGEYMCQVFRQPHLNVTHKILVLVPPSLLLDPSHGKVIVRRGSSARMICNATGVPKPTITWTYEVDGHQISSLPSGVGQIHESQLHVTSVDSQHSGLYQCSADNAVGHPAIATFNLTVLYAPELEVRPDWAHGDEGASVEFSCHCRSAPGSQVVWLKGNPKQGRLLESDDRIKIREKISTFTETWLKIQRMRREDLGSYTCLAKNTVGQTWKTVEISGLAETVQLRGNVSGEESFLLLWTTRSYSQIMEYQLKIRKGVDDGWTDVMIPVEDQTLFYTQSYNVTGLEPGQRYEAVVQAHNDFGWNRPSDTFFFAASGSMWFEETENMILTTLSFYDAELEITDASFLNKGLFLTTCRNVNIFLLLLIIVIL